MNFKSFIHLIRYDNLLVIALTMIATRYGLIRSLFYKFMWETGDAIGSLSNGIWITSVNRNNSLDAPFALLILSTVLIAAAGYIINDYFDVKTDRINKPKKIYIDNGVKRRVAMIMHIFFNALGLLLSLYASYKTQNKWLPVFSVSAIILLWFYSTHFKRQLLIGNIVVSLLTALIPIQVLYFNSPEIPSPSSYSHFLYVIVAVFCFSLFAFLLSMMREIVKDIEDYEGDAETGCKTMPVVWGIKASKAIVGGLISNTMLLLIFILYKLYKQDFNILSIYLLLFVFIPLIALTFKLYKANYKADFHQLSIWLKFIMITGVLSTVVIYFSCHGFI